MTGRVDVPANEDKQLRHRLPASVSIRAGTGPSNGVLFWEDRQRAKNIHIMTEAFVGGRQ